MSTPARRRNLKWVVAAAAVFVLVACVAGCRGRFDSKPVPYVGELDLRSGVREVDTAGVMGVNFATGTGFSGLVLELRMRVRDKNLRGLHLRLGDRLDMEHAEELASVLAPLRASGTPVHCHADGLGNATAALAAQVCTRLVLAPSGEVSTVGLAAQNIYFNKLLTEKLGIRLDVLQVGKFKGAEEPFTRDSPSPEARQSLESTLLSLQNAWATMLHARPAIEQAWQGAPYPASESKAKGRVDELGYADDSLSDLKKAAGVEKMVALRAGGEHAPSVLQELMRSEHQPDIVVLRAVGSIVMGRGGSDNVAESSFTKQVQQLSKDDAVKAVVLRIDSPGGSALASDLMWHELRKLAAKKLLVVSVGGMAASGGQYLASAGSHVFADATSIMGSIGVVGGKVVLNDATEKWGVHAETFTAAGTDGTRRARAAMESPLQAWDGPTRERVLAEMTEIYELFLLRVAEGRHLSKEQVQAHAEGKIFSGKDAVSFGLADEIGGLSEAVAYAKLAAKLPEGSTVGVFEGAGGLLERLGLTDSDTRAPHLSGWAQAAQALGAPSLVHYASSWELLRTEHVLLLAPTWLEVR